VSATATTHEKHSRLRGVEPVGFRVLAWALFVGAIFTLCAAAIREPPRIQTSAGEMALWIFLVAATSLVPLTADDGPSLVLNLPVLLGAGFVYGAVFAGSVALIGCVDIREIRRQVSIPRALLNRSQISLSVMAAAVTFHALGAHLGVWPGAAVAGLLAVAVDCLVNYSLVAVATALMTRRPIVHVLRDMRLGSLTAFIPVYVCFGFLGLLLAETYVRLGFLGVAGFVAPIILARQTFVQWRRLNDTRDSLESKSDALRRVDERIADERSDERARIAAALHDDVLQCLYNVTIRTHVIREDLRNGRLLDLDDDLPALLTASEGAVEELRDIIRGLRRSAIGHAGLVETLALLIAHLRGESAASFVVDLDATVRVEPNIELLTYQIAREALMNTLKHSGARTVWISLRQEDGGIALSIEDDGCGFALEASQDDRHFGLKLMKERALMAGGWLDLSSAPGGGTTVRARIPTSDAQRPDHRPGR
jgi:signal transduction histidine kinase